MELKELIGQRLIIGLDGEVIDESFERMVKKYKVANVILFKRNISSAEQVKHLCENIQKLVRKETGHDAFITIDQEGGMVSRLSDDCVNIPGAMAIAASGDPKNAFEAGVLTGKQLKALGINFNLAPVADINSNSNNPVIGVRSYGDSPQKVAQYVKAMAKGLDQSGVLATAKHFPGHGDTSIDSHIGLPQVDKTLDELEACEWIPFREVINAGIPAVMTAHILFPALESKQVPATMSKTIVTDILKKRMGFTGLVVSDCMEMQAIQKYYGTVKGVVEAIKAGVDMIFVSHTHQLAAKAIEALVFEVENGDISLNEMEATALKILNYKEAYIRNKQKKLDNEAGFNRLEGKGFAYELLKKTMTQVKPSVRKLPNSSEKTVFIGCKPFSTTEASNQEESAFDFPSYMAKHFGGKGVLISENPDKDEIERVCAKVNGSTEIILGTYNGHLFKGQLELVDELWEKNREAAITVVALRNPYDLLNLPPDVGAIAAFEYTGQSLKAIVDVLQGKVKMTGSLPINS